MKQHAINALGVTFALYVFSQTLLLKQYSDPVQGLLIFLMLVSVVLTAMGYWQQLLQIFSRVRVLGILISIVLFYGLISQPADLAIVLAKVLFLTSCAAVLSLRTSAGSFLRIADWVVISVSAIAVLAELGLLPTVRGDWEMLEKSSAGLINANTSMFFVFSSIAIYFVFGQVKRVVLGTLVLYILYNFGAFSRTYVVGSALLLLLSFLYHRPGFRAGTRPVLLLLMLISWSVGSIFFVTAATMPELLEPLAYTPLDWLLSLRLSTAALFLNQPANTLTGLKFSAVDSMFYEILLVFGPVYWFMFLRGAWRWWRASKRDPTAFKVFALIAVISTTGLMETLFLNLTLMSVLLFSVALLPPRYLLTSLQAHKGSGKHQ